MNIQQAIFSYIFGLLPANEQQEWERNLFHNTELKADIRAIQDVLMANKITSLEALETYFSQKDTHPEIAKAWEEIEQKLRQMQYRDFPQTYLAEATAEERTAIEAEYQQNQQIKEQIEEEETMRKWMKSAQNIEKSKEIWAYIQAEEAKQQMPTIIPIWKKPIFRMVATITLVIGIGFGTYSYLKPSEVVYDNAYFVNTYIAPVYPISGEMGKAEDFQKLLALYKSEKYLQVIQQLEKDSLIHPKANMMLAMSYLKTNEFEKGIPILESLSKSDEYANDARKYLALIWILKSEKKKAEILLTEMLQNQPSPKQKQEANQILLALQKK